MVKFGNWLTELFTTATIRRSKQRGRRGARFGQSSVRVISQADVESLEDRLLLTIDIQFDYTYDTSGFFNAQGRRDVLEEVASIYEGRITDDLTAITPGGSNSWTAIFNNPTTGTQVNIENKTIAADTVIVYVGARNLSSGLGLGGPGGFSSFATPAFNTNLETRGESGVKPGATDDTDFALWGGSIAFDSLETWNFSLDPPSTGQNDFYSVALHELAHVLGLGTSDSFRHLINGSNRFTGTQSVASFGGTILMHSDSAGNPDSGHWASGTTSTLPGTSTSQEAAMDPQVTTGTRKYLTELDWAALDDLGWDVAAAAGPVDYGDAPDATAGIGLGNYNTRAADNGPSHGVSSTLFIGAQPDGDDGSQQNATASADDSLGTNDEGFVGSDALTFVAGTTNSLGVNVTNTSGTTATLYGWVDFDQNGEFAASELAIASVPTATVNGTITLNFPANSAAPAATVSSFARFRISTDAAAASPIGAASDGEVEDHPASITVQTSSIDTLPLFTWDATAGAVRYELEVNNITTSTSQVIHQEQLTTNSFRPHTALPPGTYSWRHRPHTASAALPWSSLQQFTITEQSGTPVITDPAAADGDPGVSSLPTIAWSAVTGATRYQLWMDDLSNNVSRAIFQLSLTTTSYTPASALTSGDYRVWVRPYDAAGPLSGWSVPYDFTVAADASNAGQVISPVGTSTNGAPTIAWLSTGGTNRLIVTNTATSQTVLDIANVQGLSYTPPDGLPVGSYSARIEVDGSPAAGSASTFQIEGVTTGATFTRAVDYLTDPTPTFGWTPVTGATRYTVWVDDVSNSVSRLLYNRDITGTAYKATRALPSGVYRVWVRAYNGTTPIGSWSTPMKFFINQATTTPTISAPASVTDNTLPTITWDDVASATSYNVIVRQGGTVLEQATTNNNWLTVRNVLSPGSYEVEVTAVGVTGLNSDTSQFSVMTTSGTTELFGLSGSIVDTRPTLTWPITDSATRYAVWINDDTRSIVATVFESDLTSTSFKPDDALLPGNYRAWVRAFDGSTALTPWSAASSFVIRETDAPPTITDTGNDSTNTVPPITWTAVTGAASYEVEIVDTLTAGQPVVHSTTGVTDTIYRPTAALPVGQYAARVRSVDSGGTPSAWSSDSTFAVTSIPGTQVASLVAPVFGANSDDGSVLFAWTVSSVANVEYQLWVSNLTEGTRPIYLADLTTTSYQATGLTSGSYRAWVRTIGTGVNENWSVGHEFTVAAAETSLLDADVAVEVLLASLDNNQRPAVRADTALQADTSQHVESAAKPPAQKTATAPNHSAEYIDAVLAEVAEVLA